MIREDDTSLAVLVVEDVTETRDGVEKLLKADGYRVTVARDERDAIESARLKHPDLILVSLAGLPAKLLLLRAASANVRK
jgi:CheY-like chemotaxis protein